MRRPFAFASFPLQIVLKTRKYKDLVALYQKKSKNLETQRSKKKINLKKHNKKAPTWTRVAYTYMYCESMSFLLSKVSIFTV